MLDEFERYAVYWVPARTDGLARFGSSWMGWCAESGEPRPRHATEGMTDDIAYATRQISCHGFHGVIRAPFRLLAGRSRWSVEHALQSAAEELVATPLPDFELAVIGGQVALVPESPSRALAKAIDLIEAAVAPLAAGVVRNSRPSDVEPSVTLAAGAEQLSQLPASAAHRFHLPLTDRMDLGAAFRVRDELGPRIGPLLKGPRQLADLALMGDPGGGRPFRVLQRFELRETSAHGSSTALPCSGPQTLVTTTRKSLVEADIAV